MTLDMCVVCRIDRIDLTTVTNIREINRMIYYSSATRHTIVNQNAMKLRIVRLIAVQ
jgi:hypothetical protein